MRIELDIDLTAAMDPDHIQMMVTALVEVIGPVCGNKYNDIPPDGGEINVLRSNIEDIISRAQFELGHEMRSAFDAQIAKLVPGFLLDNAA